MANPKQKPSRENRAPASLRPWAEQVLKRLRAADCPAYADKPRHVFGPQQPPGSQSAFTLKSNPLILVTDMKLLLLIAALSACVWPTDAFAGDPSASGDHLGKAAAVSQPAEAPAAKAKVFIHPETGEILTPAQREALGPENDGTGVLPDSSPETENSPTILKGKRIDLENGDYVIVVDTPDQETAETKVWFDKEGKAHFRCSH